MGWKAPKGGDGGDFVPREQCPVGSGEHVAVLVGLVDLGHQEVPDYDDPAKQRKVWRQQVACVFEVQGPVDSKGDAFYFAERYTFSVHEKSKLRALMRMSGIPDAEDDVETLRGKPFRLKLESVAAGKDGSLSRTQLKKDGVVDCPVILLPHVKPPSRPVFTWRLGDESLEPYDWLPWLYGKHLHKVVMASWEMSHPGEPVPEAPKAAGQQQHPAQQSAPAPAPAPAPPASAATAGGRPADTPAPAAAGKPPIRSPGRSPGRAPAPAAAAEGYTPDPERDREPWG